MKKFFIIPLVFAVLTSGLFASNDIQIRSSFFSVCNHNYLNEDDTVGFGEVISAGAVIIPSFSVLAGPAFNIKLGDSGKANLEIITGIKYMFGYFSTTEYVSGKSTTIGITNVNMLHLFLWGNDVQVKFRPESNVSFVLGANISWGLYDFISQTKRSSTDPDAVFVDEPADSSLDLFPIPIFVPFIGISFNF